MSDTQTESDVLSQLDWKLEIHLQCRHCELKVCGAGAFRVLFPLMHGQLDCEGCIEARNAETCADCGGWIL